MSCLVDPKKCPRWSADRFYDLRDPKNRVRHIACTSFSGVGACGLRPYESADPGEACGAVPGGSCLEVRSLDRIEGRGLGD